MFNNYFNWLRRYAKDLSVPDIIFTPSNSEKSGCYYYPQKTEVCILGHFYSLIKGLIVICLNSTEDDHDTGNIIAHEWRHHWQRFNIANNEIKIINPDYNIPYKQTIIKYFRSSKTEMDALKFSHKYAPCQTTQKWLEFLKISTDESRRVFYK